MRLALAAASLSMVLTGAAYAADCVAPELLNSVPLTLAHDGGMPVVSASLDGKPVKLLIDTGSIVSQVSNVPAAALHLTSLATPRGQYDISGRFSHEAARITDLTLGNMEATGFYLRLVPDPNFSAEPPFDGILATDMMSRYDIDLDFGHSRLNYFSPETCQGAGVYWAPKALAILPTPTLPGRAYVDVMLDGHKVSALIDTGLRTFDDKSGFGPQIVRLKSEFTGHGTGRGDQRWRHRRCGFPHLPRAFSRWPHFDQCADCRGS